MPPRGWQWDPTLFLGTAEYYERGRLPYPAGLADALSGALGLDGNGRLLDVGCGPGSLGLLFASLFQEVVGVDADSDMLAQALARAEEGGVRNALWVHAMAEDLPLDLGTFRVASFGASFHWMDRDRVAAIIFEMLEPGGAFVQVSCTRELPPHGEDIVKVLRVRYLGETRRAGQGLLAHGTPGDEDSVLRRAGFSEAERVHVPGGQPLLRTIDDIVAMVHSNSALAPHLFGDRLADFDADLRAQLAAVEPSGEFIQPIPDAELAIWRRPSL